MKKITCVLPLLLMLAAGCAAAPEVILAQDKAIESLDAARVNLTGFADASLADLQEARWAIIKARFGADADSITDADGNINRAAYDEKLAKLDGAREREAAWFATQRAKFDASLIDLDNAREILVAVKGYLVAGKLKKEDLIMLLRSIDDILGG